MSQVSLLSFTIQSVLSCLRKHALWLYMGIAHTACLLLVECSLAHGGDMSENAAQASLPLGQWDTCCACTCLQACITPDRRPRGVSNNTSVQGNLCNMQDRGAMNCSGSMTYSCLEQGALCVCSLFCKYDFMLHWCCPFPQGHNDCVVCTCCLPDF